VKIMENKMEGGTVHEFYDQIAGFYHLIYGDWEGSVKRQAAQLDSVIREIWSDKIHTVLDTVCGIGTQSIGLAQLGYRVTASDISAAAIERAKKEAAARGVEIRFALADFRSLSSVPDASFDLVIACDNAIPHLLSDDEIRTAFLEMFRCVKPGGGCLFSVRDYDPNESGTKVVPFGVRTEGNTRYLVFQVWEYHGRIYDLSMYFLEDTGGPSCTTHVMRSKYYAVTVNRLIELMQDAGFTDVHRMDERFFQPLIVGSVK